MTTEVVLKKGVPRHPIVIESFPSKGFVSTIVGRYLIEELGMEAIGYLRSDKLGSVAIVHGARPMRPIRIYSKDDIVLIYSEVYIPFVYVSEFAEALLGWFRRIRPRQVVLLAGLTGKSAEEGHEVFGLATTEGLRLKLVELGIEEMGEGLLTGISSDLLLGCLEDAIPAVSLIVETPYSPDPLGAACVLEVMNKLLGINVDTEKLRRRGKEIEERFKRITVELQKGKDLHQEFVKYTPMYG